MTVRDTHRVAAACTGRTTSAAPSSAPPSAPTSSRRAVMCSRSPAKLARRREWSTISSEACISITRGATSRAIASVRTVQYAYSRVPLYRTSRSASSAADQAIIARGSPAARAVGEKRRTRAKACVSASSVTAGARPPRARCPSRGVARSARKSREPPSAVG